MIPDWHSLPIDTPFRTCRSFEPKVVRNLTAKTQVKPPALVLILGRWCYFRYWYPLGESFVYWCDDPAAQWKEGTSAAMGTSPMILFSLIIQLQRRYHCYAYPLLFLFTPGINVNVKTGYMCRLAQHHRDDETWVPDPNHPPHYWPSPPPLLASVGMEKDQWNFVLIWYHLKKIKWFVYKAKDMNVDIFSI